ncbi:MAG: hypothetical protein D6820_09795 [Lentisphaerae bacterium]|nr:MAG: hypothetical protein D6820_09795 [Lentisphaerota bacterium]
MLSQGLILMVMGMGMVYLFLSIMVICMGIMSSVLKPHAEAEERAERERAAQEALRRQPAADDAMVAVAIAAAAREHGI